jgi:hypothetical protein
MKNLIAMLVLAAMVTTTAEAEEIDIKWAPKWTVTDIVLESAFIGLMAVDMGTTLDQKNHAHLYEQNSILGRHPSDAKIIGYMTGGVILHAVVSHYLPKPWRNIWQIVFIGIESNSVYNNFRLGGKVSY